jgi:hypothetical protein
MTTHHPATNTAGKNNGGQDVKIQMTNQIQLIFLIPHPLAASRHSG